MEVTVTTVEVNATLLQVLMEEQAEEDTQAATPKISTIAEARIT